MHAFQLWRIVQLGVKSLLLHKLRTFLTVLGIVFGVCSVIAMLAIGEGSKAEALEQIRQLGSHNILIRSVKPSEDRSASTTTRSMVLAYGLEYEDAERLATTIPSVDVVVPVRRVLQEFRNATFKTTGYLVATVPWYYSSQPHQRLYGRYLSYNDMHERKPVAVLSLSMARALFPGEDPIGETVKAGEHYFEVVGVLEGKLAATGKETSQESLEYFAHVPLTTSIERIGEYDIQTSAGSRNAEQVQLHQLTVVVKNSEEVLGTANIVRHLLKSTHKKEDYEVIVPLELLRQAEATKRLYNIVLGSIAAISLLVGGIGIMNIMLASITERTREIGIRRALGAKRRHIVVQFLVETVVLSAGGGIIGVIVGIIIPALVTYFAQMKTIVTPASLILAFTISAGIGVVFGVYPATRAANMDPIQALRHE
ncbi:ABC transporter permease [bacterium]|nr:ABC transporter permease [bacterium]